MIVTIVDVCRERWYQKYLQVVIENRRSMALSCLFQLSPTDAIVLEL
jgi:hypothetical protein